MSKAKNRRGGKRPKAQSKHGTGRPMSQRAGIAKNKPTLDKSQRKSNTSYANKTPKATHATAAAIASQASQASQRGLSVPFKTSHKILLVGEGDFSFSLSLLQAHKCRNLVCTTFESRTSLIEKHPQAAQHVATLEAAGCRVLYSIDATTLCHPTRGGGAQLRRLGPFARVVFNFPHTGGLTRDVNRQVRANQQLCVSFLGRDSGSAKHVLAPGGRIAVTLFEGDTYELWGIRNLARHVGLAVDRSARFEWDLYPGYVHARTLGNLKNSGWRGEERAARMYVFGRPGEDDAEPVVSKQSRRRKKHSESDSDDDEDYSEGSEVGEGNSDGDADDIDDYSDNGKNGEEEEDDKGEEEDDKGEEEEGQSKSDASDRQVDSRDSRLDDPGGNGESQAMDQRDENAAEAQAEAEAEADDASESAP